MMFSRQYMLPAWLYVLWVCSTFPIEVSTINEAIAAQNTIVRDPTLNVCDQSALDTDNKSLNGPVRALILESSSMTREGDRWKRAPRKLIETRAYHPSGLLVEHVGYGTNAPFESISSALYRFKNIGLPDEKGRLIARKHLGDDTFQSESRYQYDDSGRLSQGVHESNLMATITSTYTYDTNGNLVEMVDRSSGSNSIFSRTLYSYSYSKDGQLLSCLKESQTSLPPQSQRLELFFDRNGNVIESTEYFSSDSAHRKHLLYDGMGRLTREVYISLKANRQTFASGTQIVWNSEGVIYTEDTSYEQTDLYGNWTVKKVTITEGSGARSMSGVLTLGLKGVNREEYRTLTYY